MPPKRVLVINDASDTRAVLQAVLEPRGTIVEHARTLPRSTTWPSAEVVVIDADDTAYQADWQTMQGSRVFLSSRYTPSQDQSARFLQKPFEYPDLVRTIEELLAGVPVGEPEGFSSSF